MVQYHAGEMILDDGDNASRIFALEAGQVRVFHYDGEHEVTVKLFEAPSIFGEAEALIGSPHHESVSAHTDCILVEIPVEAFRDALLQEITLASRLCFDLAERLAISIYHEKSIAYNPATVRLANHLIDHAQHARDSDGLTVEQTQDQMAKIIGVTRRSIAKEIRALVQKGLLTREAKGYCIADLEGLRRRADEQRLPLRYSIRPGN